MLVYHKQSLNIWIAVLQVTFLYSGVISIEKLIVGVMAGMFSWNVVDVWFWAWARSNQRL